jgi:malate dehydrogenase (oxaloacetate-decarboxylating)
MLCSMLKPDPLSYHRDAHGKIRLELTKKIETREELTLTYTPGVGEVSKTIHKNPETMWEYTGRGNRVAIISDGSAVLGLGDIGPKAAMPVMEGKAALFKQCADINAFPLCIDTKSADEIITFAKAIAPSFGGILLEDIAAPKCFEVEETLKRELDIPVFHDDQHGTAIVVLAGVMNALKVTNRCHAKSVTLSGSRASDQDTKVEVEGRTTPPSLNCTLDEIKIVISGAGAAGTAIARILLSHGAKHILVVDSHGIIHRKRDDLNSEAKTFLAVATNPENIAGSLEHAIKDSDVFIGVSAPRLVTKKMVRSMKKDPIIFAMANPDPEILPDEAKAAGAAVIATGRSDFPNQVNNVLAFPGVFRGALDAHATDITEAMKLAAAAALAGCVDSPSSEKILPDPLGKGVAEKVAEAVRKASLSPQRGIVQSTSSS